MWSVELHWKSECYITNWIKIFKKHVNAKACYRENIIKEYKNWSDNVISDTYDTEDILSNIMDLIEESDNSDDYEYEIILKELITED
mgnify:CR=1 FL=1